MNKTSVPSFLRPDTSINKRRWIRRHFAAFPSNVWLWVLGYCQRAADPEGPGAAFTQMRAVRGNSASHLNLLAEPRRVRAERGLQLLLISC